MKPANEIIRRATLSVYVSPQETRSISAETANFVNAPLEKRTSHATQRFGMCPIRPANRIVEQSVLDALEFGRLRNHQLCILAELY